MITMYKATRIKYEPKFFLLKITLHTDMQINSKEPYSGNCLSEPVCHSQSFEDISPHCLFENEKRCQAYCDFLNEQS